MRGATAKTHGKRIELNCKNHAKIDKIMEKTTNEPRARTERPSDTEFHRFFSIFVIPGGGRIDKKSQTMNAEIHAFFRMRTKSQKSAQKIRRALLGGMRGAGGR